MLTTPLAMPQVQIDINLIKTKWKKNDFDICSLLIFPFQDYVPIFCFFFYISEQFIMSTAKYVLWMYKTFKNLSRKKISNFVRLLSISVDWVSIKKLLLFIISGIETSNAIKGKCLSLGIIWFDSSIIQKKN